MKHSRTKKVLLIILIALSGLILLLFILFNTPFGHRFITNRVNGILAGAGIPIHITSITSIYPESVAVTGVLLTGSDNDTIIYAGEIQAEFVPVALLKKRVIISSVILIDARVNLSRKNNKLNIAGAFSKGEKKNNSKNDKPKKKWEVTVANADISGIRFQMNDSLSGIHIIQKIGELKIKMNKMSLLEHTLMAHSLELNGAEGSIKIDSHQEKKDTTDGVSWNIGLDKFAMKKINLAFNNTAGKQKIDLVLDEASVGIDKMDLKNKIIDFDKISFFQTSISIITDSGKDKPKEPKKGLTGTFPWDIEAGAINLENVTFKVSNYYDSVPRFGIKDLTANLSDIKLNNEEITLDIDKTMFNLDNGFSMKAMKGKVESRSGKTYLKLSVETANSLFNIESKTDGNLLVLLSKPFEIKKASVSITDTELSLKDLLYFKPGLKKKPVFIALDKSPFRINVSMKLLDSVITVPEIKIEKDNQRIILAGKIENAFIKGREKGELNLSVPDLNVTFLKSQMKEAGLMIDLPEISNLSITAALSGSRNSADFNIGLSGDIGKTDITGTFEFENDIFYAKSVFKDVLPGKILRNPLLGVFNGSVEVNGSGIRKKPLVADIAAIVDSLGFKGFTYTRTRFDCKIDSKNYNINLKIDDPSIKCNLEASINTADSTLDVKSKGSFFAQLNKLNLYKDTLGIGGNIKAAFKKTHNQIQSDLTFSDMKVNTARDNSILPETTVSFNSDSFRTVLNSGSDFFNIKVDIEKPLSELGLILPGYKRYAETFIDSSRQDRLNRISFLPDMKASIIISPHKALWLILNDTSIHFSDFELNFMNNPHEDKIHYNLTGRNIKYKSINIGNISTNLTDSAGRIDLLASAENCSVLSRRLSKILIINHFSNRLGITDFTLYEKPDKILYNFEISSLMDSTGIVFSVPLKQLTMNGVKWQMDTPDLFKFNRSVKAFLVSLRMHTNGSSLNITSDMSDGLHTRCEMNQVDIASLLPVHLIQGNPAGSISGTADYTSGLDKGKEFHSALNFNDISWSDINFRFMTLKGNYKSETSKNYIADLTAGMDSSNFSLKASKPAIGNRKLSAEFTNLSIKNFQPFVKKFLSDLKGQISGNLNILSAENIDLDGELDFKGANVRINTLNSVFRIPSDKIIFKGKKIIFDTFRVLDSLNNELIVDGSLNFIKAGVISSDLQITSKNLQVMKSTEKESPTFFGNIFVDSKLSISGPLTSPDLKGNILLAGGTEIFFRQKENLDLTESAKVLTFVDRSASTKNSSTEAEKSIYTKTSIDAVVKIDPETKINFELSKRLFNIELMIQGGGELNYNMLANRDVNLSGKYEISDGTADVKITGWPNKAFRISKGGYVKWDGKLKDPELNFQAISKVHSSYLNPVDNKQRDADFNVTLKLADRLSNLDLLFTINTPDQYLMSIINTLSPEEQMRQAITILLFGKIDLPGISTSSDYMTEQVNQLVASQLNQLTKTSISGIDISFGIDSYVQASQSGGQETKTSLSYEVKKALLNNRAQIEVSGRLNDANKSPGASDLSLNNVSFEYRLDSAGTIFMKVYNEHTYEDVFEGEVIKTGVGLTYRKNYPTLGDIWKKERKNKKQENQVK